MPHENKIYISILILMLFITAILIPIFIRFARHKVDVDVVTPNGVKEEVVENGSISEYFEGKNTDDVNLGQYFVEDPFRDTCSGAEGAVSSNTVCVR